MWKGPSPGPSSGFVFLRRLCTKTEKEGFVALFQKQERGHNLPTLPTKRGPGPNTISCQRDAEEQDQQDLLTSLAEAARAEDSSIPQKATRLGVKGMGCPAWEVAAWHESPSDQHTECTRRVWTDGRTERKGVVYSVSWEDSGG